MGWWKLGLNGCGGECDQISTGVGELRSSWVRVNVIEYRQGVDVVELGSSLVGVNVIKYRRGVGGGGTWDSVGYVGYDG